MALPYRRSMDELSTIPGGCRLSLEAAGDTWAWRLVTQDGRSVAGLAPDRSAAQRSAAFAAFAVSALARVARRRF
jgi:hypothetical protein